eukprot:1343799-Rhodomonas_salina.3
MIICSWTGLAQSRGVDDDAHDAHDEGEDHLGGPHALRQSQREREIDAGRDRETQKTQKTQDADTRRRVHLETELHPEPVPKRLAVLKLRLDLHPRLDRDAADHGEARQLLRLRLVEVIARPAFRLLERVGVAVQRVLCGLDGLALGEQVVEQHVEARAQVRDLASTATRPRQG